LLLDHLVNGRPSRRPGFPSGNRRGGAPQGAYRCAGDDKWVVVSCTTDDHWRAFVTAVGDPKWASSYGALADRVARADELDAQVEQWTSSRDRYDVMSLLQAHGVPAGAVQDSRDRLLTDPQLAARGHFTRGLAHPDVQRDVPLEGVPVHMSATPQRTGGVIDRAPPSLGGDTAEVLGSLLEMSADDLAALDADGVLA
jgi:crotonobetainyl-CoA:carnitine CoA-transferase CaiB-like acyl-CoA transferase